ncbi:hypothetical protein DL98DRAFT_512686 [Cadophora sp. DSE1049]|nr:hypothetical protein DL98DRAFT_512686 [Cadophora sp. DSE1049]
MSDLDRAKKAFAMSAGLPATSSGQPTSPKRVSDIIDLTLSDEEIPKSDDGSEDDFDNGSEMVMPDGPSTAAPAYNAPLTMDYQPDPILPRDVNWPFILKMTRNTPKCLIPRQFITPSLFGRRLDLLNPHHRFTTPQYKAAWVYTVNQCRDKVDLTTTFACNPGLDQHSFLKLIDDVIEQIAVNVCTSRNRQHEVR